MTNDVKQYNAVVEYLTDSKYGVTGGNLHDYITFFQNVLQLSMGDRPTLSKITGSG